ncbi:MAG: hypothetical protein JWP69_1384 [Flaviaesturariibacter sp.]|nr:hypothetical protein [Flaviaesturariibacter sp.]
MKLIASLLLMSIASTVLGQVSYQPLSFTEALARAGAEGKLVFLQFESKDCNQCNEVADKGLSDTKLSALINQTFIPIKITASHPDRDRVANSYNTVKSFGSLFIDAAGTLIHKMPSSSSSPTPYFKEVDLALNKAGESMRISALEKEYKSGNRSPGFIEALLLKKRTLNLATEALLDEYVQLLPIDSFQSIRTLTFIAQMTPLLDSKADMALRKNYPLFTKAWYTLPQATRVRINNAIVYHSMQKAIANKDEAFALRTATFAQRVHDPNFAAGAKAYDKNMLNFYDAVGDTSKFFMKSIAYYERYFMTVSPDSIKRIDSLNWKRMASASIARKDTVAEGNKMRISQRVAFAPYAQTFTAELNDGANNFYKKTANPYLLSVATEWIKKGLAFYSSPEALDTYSRLLYKQGQREKAMDMQAEVLAIRKHRGYSTKEQEALLAKMKAGNQID